MTTSWTFWVTVSALALTLGGITAPAANATDMLFPAPLSIAAPGSVPAVSIPAVSIPAVSMDDLRAGAPPSAFLSDSDRKWKRQWALSLAPLLASESLDAASSYGRRELNPLLAGADGGFGAKACAIKFGVFGAMAAVEYVLVRKHPGSAKFLSIVNWTTAGATTGLAVHNFQLPR